MRIVALAAALALTGCSPYLRTDLITRPAEGYEALRFKETVRYPGPLGNTLEFAAGTLLVADRRRSDDGERLYCGPMIIQDLLRETRPTCVSKRGNSLFLVTDVLREGWERSIPPGAIEEVRAP